MEMAAAADTACGSEGAEVTASNEAAATEVTIPAESNVGATAEVCVRFFFNCMNELYEKGKNNLPFVFQEGDGNSIADMLRATAEEAMTQTGFVFDENTGMYYDHSTGFYYDSVCEPKLQSYC